MRRAFGTVVLLEVVSLLAPAAAHPQASIDGTVSDASGLELSGVRIEVSSPALSGKTRTV
jgi:hypothetical protein